MVGKVKGDNEKSVFKRGLDGVSSIGRAQMMLVADSKLDTNSILAILLSPSKFLPNSA